MLKVSTRHKTKITHQNSRIRNYKNYSLSHTN